MDNSRAELRQRILNKMDADIEHRIMGYEVGKLTEQGFWCRIFPRGEAPGSPDELIGATGREVDVLSIPGYTTDLNLAFKAANRLCGVQGFIEMEIYPHDSATCSIALWDKENGCYGYYRYADFDPALAICYALLMAVGVNIDRYEVALSKADLCVSWSENNCDSVVYIGRDASTEYTETE